MSRSILTNGVNTLYARLRIDSAMIWGGVFRKERYSAKPAAVSSRPVPEEGLALAKQRRAALKKLIDSDPALALSSAIGREVRNADRCNDNGPQR